MSDFFAFVAPSVNKEAFAKVYGNNLAGVTPFPSRIAVIDRLTMRILFSSETFADGAWERYVPASYVSVSKLTIIGFDDTGTYNAVVADNVSAELVV